jgi:hypothetical protein
MASKDKSKRISLFYGFNFPGDGDFFILDGCLHRCNFIILTVWELYAEVKGEMHTRIIGSQSKTCSRM